MKEEMICNDCQKGKREIYKNEFFPIPETEDRIKKKDPTYNSEHGRYLRIVLARKMCKVSYNICTRRHKSRLEKTERHSVFPD